ncbi:hypothetical protein Anas_06134 [Armadillidium nasatum]|uniref:Uncharacterized protein n=1 Tax=Armadillidium nasatum TaxID=96803 RepID=A0A5N5TBT4_9CRUS|nr:hypothetical protein Anas_06134 [Armadillidium nasatum]
MLLPWNRGRVEKLCFDLSISQLHILFMKQMEPIFEMDKTVILIKKNYELEFENLLRNSSAVTFKERNDLDKVVSPGKSYVVFVQKKNDSDDSSFRLFGEVNTFRYKTWSSYVRYIFNPIPNYIIESFILSIGIQYKIYGILILQELEMWNLDARDHHKSAWRLFYKNATLFVIGYPLSPYRKYMPKNQRILSGDASTDMEINNGGIIP